MNTCRYHLIVNMPYDLLHFLIKENCFEEYIHYAALDKEKCLTKNNTLMMFAVKDKKHYISAAFLWNCSKSGWDYWNSKSLKWETYIKTNLTIGMK